MWTAMCSYRDLRILSGSQLTIIGSRVLGTLRKWDSSDAILREADVGLCVLVHVVAPDAELLLVPNFLEEVAVAIVGDAPS